MLDEVDTVAGNVGIMIDDVNIIFMDILVSLESADSFVENRVENHLFLLKGD